MPFLILRVDNTHSPWSPSPAYPPQSKQLRSFITKKMGCQTGSHQPLFPLPLTLPIRALTFLLPTCPRLTSLLCGLKPNPSSFLQAFLSFYICITSPSPRATSSTYKYIQVFLHLKKKLSPNPVPFSHSHHLCLYFLTLQSLLHPYTLASVTLTLLNTFHYSQMTKWLNSLCTLLPNHLVDFMM